MTTNKFFGSDNVSNVEFYKDKAGEHRWRLRATNGEIIAASSESFFSSQGAVNNFKLTLKIGTDVTTTSAIP